MLSFHSLMMSLSIMYLGSTFTSRIWRKRKGKRLGSKQSSLCYFFLFVCVCDFEGSDTVGGDFIHSERSKKERLRRLSAVGRTSSSYEDYEMGCDVSDREDELRVQAPSMSNGSSKRFKISRKVDSFRHVC